MIRVMVAAAYSEVREGLSTLLALAGGVEVIGTAADLPGAAALACAARPDVVLVDLEMPRDQGREILRQLKSAARLVALTAHDYPAARESALRAGADVVVVKGLGAAEMVAAIRAAAAQNERMDES